jgi:enoyl-CoA hydratase/carnithine racemase
LHGSRIGAHGEDVFAYACTLVRTKSPRSTAAIKAQVWQAPRQDCNEALADTAIQKSSASADFREGTAHYMEKRLPAFTGA